MISTEDFSEDKSPISNRKRFLRNIGTATIGATTALGVSSFSTPFAVQAAGRSIGTFLDKGGAAFNVNAYSGATDADRIIAAINAAQARGGGIVYLPEGVYNVTKNIQIASNGITLMGAGQNATTLLVSDTYLNGDVITFFPAQVGGVRMLTIKSNQQRSGGAGINIQYSKEIYIQDVDMSNMFIGCNIVAAILVYVDRGYFTNFSPGGCGIWIDGTGIANNGNDHYISNIVMDNSSVLSNQPGAGIRITGSGGTWLHSLDIIHAQTGLLIDPPSGNIVQWCFFDNCAWDSSGYRGITIQPAAGGVVKGLNFSNCWSSSSVQYDGCLIAGSVDGVQFVGHRFLNNRSHGLIVYGPAKNIFVDSSVAAGNNQGNIGSHGMTFTNNCDTFAIRNCRSGDMVFGITQDRGISIEPGCNKFIVTNNITLGNNLVGIQNSGGPTYVVNNNL